MKKLIIILALIATFIVGCWISDEEAEKAKQDFDRHPHKVLVP